MASVAYSGSETNWQQMTDKIQIRFLIDCGLYKAGKAYWVVSQLATYMVEVKAIAEYVESGKVDGDVS